MKKLRLGDLLLEKEVITQEQLVDALRRQRENGKKLGQTLIEMGIINESQLLHLLSEKLAIPYIDLETFTFDPALVQQLPEMQARRYRAILLKEEGGVILVGLADPLDLYAFDEIGQILRRPLKLAIVSESSLLSMIDRAYRRTQEISGFAKELSGELAEQTNFNDGMDIELGAEDAPVVKLLNSIYGDAVQAHASDIHIEPDANGIRVRLRVDGVLQESLLEDNRIAPALVQRLKLKARLNIAEKRIPQDGSFNLEIKGRIFDVRLATMPVVYGEAVVMRLLERAITYTDFSQLGMPEILVERITKIIQHPHGMLLVTGPTGSGKTTTLYSVLQRLNREDKKIITVEDPVEYHLERVNQVQVNYKIDLTFDRILRAILRHDPDIIMVGEIRDRETAQIALRAAITGHLVLATLHTNDAMSSAMRLIDMGCEGYMVASAVKAVVAQRLIRKICPFCIAPYQLDSQELAWLTGIVGSAKLERYQFKIGKGCQRCSNKGYQGRVGIYELLELDPDMLQALRANDPAAFVTATLKNPYYKPLGQVALEFAAAGVTTVAEVIRVTGELEDEYRLMENANA